MNQKSLVWLLLALILAFYSLYVFLSNGSETAWPIVTGTICAVGAGVSFWRSMVEVRADREEED
ncbi:hypothetical protein ACIPY3_18310 [Paenarthrobacter sp. NPDC089714]|uniref:hypothetical protein n=1 Tax=unclassified Paenarthrobacter TaxID=2634190 RepID=UPI0037CA0E78